MTILISYILGILTVFLLGMAFGMFVVVRRTQSLQKKIDNINLEISSITNDVHQTIRGDKSEIDLAIQDLYREIEKRNDEVSREIDRTATDLHRTMDSRLNKLENKLMPSDATKTLLKG